MGKLGNGEMRKKGQSEEGKLGAAVNLINCMAVIVIHCHQINS